MRELNFPRVFERVLEHTLSNGLTVRVVPKPGFARRYAFFATNFGSIDTAFSVDGKAYRVPDGIAHYLEHKMFDMPTGNVMQQFASTGANPNAFTSYDMTAYYFDCTDEFAANLRLLLEYVSTPYFTQESVEKERGIIAQEIRMYEDSPSSQIYEQLFAAMYRHHPVRVPIAGTVESIDGITAQTLTDCYHAFYVPSNMCLCVVGDVDADEVFRIAEDVLPKERCPIAQRDYGPEESLICGGLRVERQMPVSMPMFMLGFKCSACGMDALKADLLGDLAVELLAGEASPLYMKLYESGLIDGSFSVGYESLHGVSMLVMTGDSNDPEAVCTAILDENARIVREGADENLFHRLKRSALGRRLRGLDGFESICHHQCSYFFENVEYFDFPALYESMTQADVLDFLSRNAVESRSGMSVIRPL